MTIGIRAGYKAISLVTNVAINVAITTAGSVAHNLLLTLRCVRGAVGERRIVREGRRCGKR